MRMSLFRLSQIF